MSATRQPPPYPGALVNNWFKRPRFPPGVKERLGYADRAVFDELCDRCSNSRKQYYETSVRDFASSANIPKSTIGDALKKFEEAGLVFIYHGNRNGLLDGLLIILLTDIGGEWPPDDHPIIIESCQRLVNRRRQPSAVSAPPDTVSGPADNVCPARRTSPLTPTRAREELILKEKSLNCINRVVRERLSQSAAKPTLDLIESFLGELSPNFVAIGRLPRSEQGPALAATLAGLPARGATLTAAELAGLANAIAEHFGLSAHDANAAAGGA